MSHERTSKGSNLRPETTEAPKPRPSRGRFPLNIFETPKDDNQLVVRRRSKLAALDNTESRGRQAEERPKPMPPTSKWTRERSVSSDEESYSTSSLGPEKATFDIVCDPGRPRNMTVQVRLPVSPDLDDELEEFQRFVRRGEFGDAKTFFDENLKVHITYPWVFVQYAEMLFEMGDYKSVLQLDSEPVFRHLYQDPIDTDSVPTRILEINWELLKASCLRYGQHELKPVLDELFVQPSTIIPLSAGVGSTEIRIICLSMKLMDLTKRRNARTKAFPSDLSKWGEWRNVYRELQAQGRIWDFGDLFTTACACFGTDITEEQFFESGNIFDALEADWNIMAVDDESTVLAVVDLLTTMALLAITPTEVKPIGEKYLSWATRIVEAAISVSPRCAKSRPFLRFMVAQSSLSLRRGKRSRFAHDHLAGFPGLSVLSPGIDMPYYIPVGKENPGWVPPDLPKTSFEPLEMALKASRDLKDYRIQALCLKELALWSREPSGCFEELSRLQTEKQQDMEGYLATCLSRYLFETNEDGKAKLLSKLNDFGAWEGPPDLISPDKSCARDIIQQALAPLRSTSAPQYVKAGLRYYAWLPDEFRRFIDRHVERLPRLPIPIPQHLPPPPGAPRPPPPPPPPTSAPPPPIVLHHDNLQDYHDKIQASNSMRTSRGDQPTPVQEKEAGGQGGNDSTDRKSPPTRLSPGTMLHSATTSKPTVEDGSGSSEDTVREVRG